MEPQKTTKRFRLFEIIEAAGEDDRISNVYDVAMMLTILTSLIPLTFKTDLYPAVAESDQRQLPDP